MFFKIIPAIILVLLTGLFFGSCDFATDPSVNTISGKIFSYGRVPSENLKVTVQNSSAYTSSDGSFSLNGITFPYDLVVKDTLNRLVVVYRGISADNIELPLQWYGYNRNHAVINVQLPPEIFHPPDIKCKIIFTDGKFINRYTEVSEFVKNINFNIDFPYNNSNSATGKLIIITYRKDNQGNVLSYENYGESQDFQINNGGTFNYAFDNSALSLNPGEETIECSINVNNQQYSTLFYLSFGKDDSGFDQYKNVFSYLRGTAFNFKIPTGLPREFSARINNTNSDINFGWSYGNFKVYPDIMNELTVNTAPSQVTPEDGVKDVDNRVQFSFNSGTGNGVYIISLNNISRNYEYRIFTESNYFTLEGLEDLGFGRINNNIFSWQVNKTGPVNSMNDFAVDFFNKENHYILQSAHRIFSTKP